MKKESVQSKENCASLLIPQLTNAGLCYSFNAVSQVKYLYLLYILTKLTTDLSPN